MAWISQRRRPCDFSAPSALIFSRRSDTSNPSDRCSIGIGLGLGFPDFYLGVVHRQPLDWPVSADTLLEPSRWWSPSLSDPRQFMRNHKLRVHVSSGMAGIHENVPSHCTQCRIALMNGCLPRFGRGASAFSGFGWRHFSRPTLWFTPLG
jgi:hypothetical protein